MQDFYNSWLAESERVEKAVQDAPRVARGKDLNLGKHSSGQQSGAHDRARDGVSHFR